MEYRCPNCRNRFTVTDPTRSVCDNCGRNYAWRDGQLHEIDPVQPPKPGDFRNDLMPDPKANADAIEKERQRNEDIERERKADLGESGGGNDGK